MLTITTINYIRELYFVEGKTFTEIEKIFHGIIEQDRIRIQEKKITPRCFPDPEIIRPTESQIPVTINISYARIL